MSEYQTPLIASEEVRKNFIKSFLLVSIVAALVIAASWYLGDLLGDVKMGLIIGGIVVAVVLPLQIFTAKWAILGMTRGRAADPDDLQERRLLHLAEGLCCYVERCVEYLQSVGAEEKLISALRNVPLHPGRRAGL